MTGDGPGQLLRRDPWGEPIVLQGARYLSGYTGAFDRSSTKEGFETGTELWINLAAPQGFEPRYADPESAVLPLNEGAAAVNLILATALKAVNPAIS